MWTDTEQHDSTTPTYALLCRLDISDTHKYPENSKKFDRYICPFARRLNKTKVLFPAKAPGGLMYLQ